jgi:hypothetical protein
MDTEFGIKKYCNYMEGVKLRVSAIKTIGSQPIIDLLHGVTQIESIYLQFRMILELIAMGSLINNHDEYSKARESFKKDWNAKKILENLVKVNPGFFPRPVSDVGGSYLPREGALTQDEFVKLYNSCGRVLHTANPFGAQIDHKIFSDEVSAWLSKIIILLNMHQIRMVGDDGFWLIQMCTPTRDQVHYYRFVPTD